MAPRFAFLIRADHPRAIGTLPLLRLAVLFRSVMMVCLAVRVLALVVTPRMMRTGGTGTGTRCALRFLRRKHNCRHCCE
jgi:hypothetical protein